ncbi:MAG: hypothetical protein ABIU06_10010 [Anaerolineales bacterium]
MKYHIQFVLLLVIAITVSGCAGNASATISPTSTIESAIVEDQASLVAALQAEGAAIEAGDPVEQDFFSPLGNIIKVNGADVQVFEYESAEAMENEASQVAPDGGSIGTSMVMWVDPPHFYKAGRIIVLYIGSDETVLSLLEQVLGKQFAGR